MSTTLQRSYRSSYNKQNSSQPVWSRFISWCSTQEKNRLTWQAGTLAGHGCFMTPLTLFAVMVSGNSILFLALVVAAMVMSFVTNLAALPTKITIPVLFMSLLIDAVIVISCIIGNAALNK